MRQVLVPSIQRLHTYEREYRDLRSPWSLAKKRCVDSWMQCESMMHICDYAIASRIFTNCVLMPHGLSLKRLKATL